MLGQRIGTFLFFVGLLLIVLFVLTDMSGKAQFGYFALGVLGILGGVMLWWRAPSAPPPPPSGRFGLINNLKKRGANKAKKK
jgi:hypothetical protein